MFDYLALLLWSFGLVLLVPLVMQILYIRSGRAEAPGYTYWVPAVGTLLLAIAMKRNLRFPPLDNRRAMILCALGWIVVSAAGAVPFWLGLKLSFLDAYFETVSGFTTTGITVLSGLDQMPRSILFWRSFIQWLGGLGILTFFLAILYTGGSAQRLFGAESHKVFARRPVPSLLRTLRILWLIYAVFTAVTAAALLLEGMTVFDAVSHAMTAISTGGYSSHDASIDYFRLQGYSHAILIEYTIIAAMLAGGISFFVHYRLLRGGVRALWDSLEMKLWWLIIAGATIVVMVEHLRRFPLESESMAMVHDAFRTSLFQVVALVTTTGFGTKDIGADYFPAAAKQIFLVLMIIGGCVGSTSGGIKVLRIGVLLKMVFRQVRRLVYGHAVIQPLVVDGEAVDDEELHRIAALFFAWLALLAAGSLVTALLSGHDALASASGMFSALGNIGPCYIPTPQMAALHPAIKIVYIFGMLAGRLEILPLLLLVSRRTWR